MLASIETVVRRDDTAAGRTAHSDSRTSAVRDADEATLGVLANAGDTDAIAEYFARSMPLLRGIARGIAVGLIDADDLLSDATAAVIAKWNRGAGPTTYITSYIAQAMRNRIKDELRSPRSRVAALPEGDEPAVDDASARRTVEWHREHDILRRALRALPADQRSVLLGTIVDDRKPGDMVAELGRPAGSVYSLLRRAKLRLRRTLLVEAMSQNAVGRDCRTAARRLPDILPADLDDAGDAPSWLHIRACGSCRSAWGVYDSLAEAARMAA